MQRELDRFARPRYLEIGVGDGTLFLNLRAAQKVGVDPSPGIGRIRWQLHRLAANDAQLVIADSDRFFEGLDPAATFDVVFVDGYHTYEQALRDVEGSLAHISETGAVLVHDCNPPSEAAALRDSWEALERGSPEWCGDVWKAVVHLRATRDDLETHVLDTDFGIAVVRPGRFDPLPLTPQEVAELDYADLDSRRTELLGLTPGDRPRRRGR